MAESKSIIQVGAIQNRIFLIQAEKVIVDSDLAEFHGVFTKALNQVVRRNIERFPDEIMLVPIKNDGWTYLGDSGFAG